MVLNEALAGDDSCQFACEHHRQSDYGCQISSFVNFSSFRDFPEKQLSSDDKTEGTSTQSKGRMKLGFDVISFLGFKESDNIPDDISPGPFDSTSSPNVMSSAKEVVKLEHGKRPLIDDDGSYQNAIKRTKQLDQNSEVSYFKGRQSISGDPHEDTWNIEVQADDASESPARLVPSLSFPWITCSNFEEAAPFQLSSFPGYFESGQRTAVFNQQEERDSWVIDHPHRKPVAIGPGHQADIPVWRSQDCPSSDGHGLLDEDDSGRMIGTSVMSLPSSLEVGARDCRVESKCPDEGSIRCTRYHVMEAREELMESLGERSFRELGFCEMGEDVARRWTEEEQLLFEEVIAANPASLGKCFWDELPHAFPNRSSKELVSYYFNVFMLRKRAQQNRSYPLHADSDDDEWEGSSNDDELAEIESLTDCDIDGDGLHEEEDEDMDGSESDDPIFDDDDDEELCFEDKSKAVYGERGIELEDDSCTSFEGQKDGLGLVSVGDEIMGQCVMKAWGMNYTCGDERGVDFLPTCKVIEEVLGNVNGSSEKDSSGIF